MTGSNTLDKKQDRHRTRLRRSLLLRMAVALRYAFDDGMVRLRAITDEEWKAIMGREEEEL